MASESRSHKKKDSLRLSDDNLESVSDSEGPISSVIQLPQVKSEAFAGELHLGIAPPPLPPKPAFARGNAVGGNSVPPPLPPKTHHLRKESSSSPEVLPRPSSRREHLRVSSSPALPSFTGPSHLPQKVQHVRVGSGPAGLSGSGPPPLPPKPDGALAEKFISSSQQSKRKLTSPNLLLDSAEQLDPTKLPNFLPPPSRPVPPTPRSRKPSYGDDGSWAASILDDPNQAEPPQPPEPTIVSDGDPMRSSLGQLEHSTLSLSDPIPNLTLPLPPPPYTANNHRISLLFPPVLASEIEESTLPHHAILLSKENAEYSKVGAYVLGRERSGTDSLISSLRKPPIQWQLYSSQAPGGEVWSVLHEYLTNEYLKTHGRNRALQLLTGYVVGGCLEGSEVGLGLLTEIVKRMRGAERSERDGSIFTLLINIGAHASFVEKSYWHYVEQVVLKVFSNVIEQMYGHQDDDVMWERALRCFFVLLRSSDNRISDQISSPCLAALALHVGVLTHTDADRILITNGICPRLQSPLDEKISSVGIDFECLSQIGGIQTILALFAETCCLSARHSLFRVVYDIAVLKCLQDVSDDEVEILKDHVVTFRALLEAFEMADCFVHSFRVGPWPGFVMECVKMMLFDPLSGDVWNSLAARAPEEADHHSASVLQETEERSPSTNALIPGAVSALYRSSASRHLFSVRALVKLLDKQFCLRVLQQMEKMAQQEAELLAQKECMHYAREWKILRDVECHVQLFLTRRKELKTDPVLKILTQLNVAVVDITSGRSSVRYLLRMAEMIVEFFTIALPFSKMRSTTMGTSDSVTAMFLKGELLVSKALLNEADPSIFTLLLLATRRKTVLRRLSECRQCLVEFMGYSKERASHLATFTEDEDSAVAYRSAELVSKYSEANSQISTPTSCIQGR